MAKIKLYVGVWRSLVARPDHCLAPAAAVMQTVVIREGRQFKSDHSDHALFMFFVLVV